MAQVKLILSEAVPNLGEPGDLVSVRPGYARNYLIPQGKAAPATAAGIRELEHRKRVIAEKTAKQRSELEALRDRMQAVELEVAARVGEEGKLFGSVTAIQIAELLAEKGFDVDRRKIGLDEPIKEAGEHKVPIRLQRDLVAEIALKVTAIE